MPRIMFPALLWQYFMVKTGVVRIMGHVFISGGPGTHEKYSEYEM